MLDRSSAPRSIPHRTSEELPPTCPLLASSLLTIWPERKCAPVSGCLLERTTCKSEADDDVRCCIRIGAAEVEVEQPAAGPRVAPPVERSRCAADRATAGPTNWSYSELSPSDHVVAASAHSYSVTEARPRWRGASEILLARQWSAPCRRGVAFGRQSTTARSADPRAKGLVRIPGATRSGSAQTDHADGQGETIAPARRWGADAAEKGIARWMPPASSGSTSASPG